MQRVSVQTVIVIGIVLVSVYFAFAAAWRTEFQMLSDYNEGPFQPVGFVDYDIATASTQSYSLASASKAQTIFSTYSATGASTLHFMTDLLSAGREIKIVDAGGNSDPNSIVLDTQGSETINGGNTYTLATDYKQITCRSNGTNWYCY